MKENPINIPRVPPTFAIKAGQGKIRYSVLTFLKRLSSLMSLVPGGCSRSREIFKNLPSCQSKVGCPMFSELWDITNSLTRHDFLQWSCWSLFSSCKTLIKHWESSSESQIGIFPSSSCSETGVHLFSNCIKLQPKSPLTCFATWPKSEETNLLAKHS